VALVTHQAEPVRFYDDLLRGRGVLVNFMYTSCLDLCPLSTANLARLQELLADRLGRDLVMLSITVDPERDTPEVLRRYAATHGARPGWYFLTGRRADLEAVQRSLGFVDPPGGADPRQGPHTALLVIGHEARGRWLKLDVMTSPAQIADAVRRVVGPAP
jgi:protein SCO1/2